MSQSNASSRRSAFGNILLFKKSKAFHWMRQSGVRFKIKNHYSLIHGPVAFPINNSGFTSYYRDEHGLYSIYYNTAQNGFLYGIYFPSY